MVKVAIFQNQKKHCDPATLLSCASERKKRISESVHTNERIDSLNESNFSSLLWQRPRYLAVVGRADSPPRVSVQQLMGREAVRIGHSHRSVSSLSLAHCALRTPKAVKFITYSFIGKFKQTFYFTLSCFIKNTQAEMRSLRPVCRNNNSDFFINTWVVMESKSEEFASMI